MRILVADDDRTSRTLLVNVLEQWGYEVAEYEDGDSAWAALQSPPYPEILILDWIMPGLEGVRLCEMLRSQQRDHSYYIILLTARGSRDDMVAGLEAGADDYITKPYDAAELHARINVGRRIVQMQEQLNQRSKLQGVLEMAGAVCHELNQPLQSLLGYSELLMMPGNTPDHQHELLSRLHTEAERIGDLTRQIMAITRYRSKSYMNGSTRIVDIRGASAPEDTH